MPPVFTGVRFQSTLPTRGSDPRSSFSRSGSYQFQSTLPTRGSDAHQLLAGHADIAISIHAPHEGERPCGGAHPGRRRVHFNPRSPRGGATLGGFQTDVQDFHISIHAPHEGERLVEGFKQRLAVAFQSTLPTRGSDAAGHAAFVVLLISIHAPHEGERPDVAALVPRADRISIHAPHEGERHAGLSGSTIMVDISIHAPHEGERRPNSVARPS